LVAEVLSREGFSVYPAPGMRETFSMITAIHLGSREGMEAFCKAVQRMSPVGSYIEPVPGEAVQRMVPVCSGTCRAVSPYTFSRTLGRCGRSNLL
jgi:cystathionine beta-lyase family protein involved in aluminum resistance